MKKIYIEKVCPYCSKFFIPKRDNQIYCKKKHQPNRIRYRSRSPAKKRARKKYNIIKKFGQKISRYFKKEILEIYNNRPVGYDVDHIYPLNHPLFCGLHVPWNLQYLPKLENIRKSNKV